MFLAGFSDVTNHVSKMKNSEVSLFCSGVAICRPVTVVAWIGKIFFFKFLWKCVPSDSLLTQYNHDLHTTLIPHLYLNHKVFWSQSLFNLQAWKDWTVRFVLQFREFVGRKSTFFSFMNHKSLHVLAINFIPNFWSQAIICAGGTPKNDRKTQ